MNNPLYNRRAVEKRYFVTITVLR